MKFMYITMLYRYIFSLKFCEVLVIGYLLMAYFMHFESIQGL